MDDIASAIVKRIVGQNKIQQIVKNPQAIQKCFKEELGAAMKPAGVEVTFGGIYQLGIPPQLVRSMAQSAISVREA